MNHVYRKVRAPLQGQQSGRVLRAGPAPLRDAQRPDSQPRVHPRHGPDPGEQCGRVDASEGGQVDGAPQGGAACRREEPPGRADCHRGVGREVPVGSQQGADVRPDLCCQLPGRSGTDGGGVQEGGRVDQRELPAGDERQLGQKSAIAFNAPKIPVTIDITSLPINPYQSSSDHLICAPPINITFKYL